MRVLQPVRILPVMLHRCKHVLYLVDRSKVERERGVTAANPATEFFPRAKLCPPHLLLQPYHMLLHCPYNRVGCLRCSQPLPHVLF